MDGWDVGYLSSCVCERGQASAHARKGDSVGGLVVVVAAREPRDVWSWRV